MISEPQPTETSLPSPVLPLVLAILFPVIGMGLLLAALPYPVAHREFMLLGTPSPLAIVSAVAAVTIVAGFIVGLQPHSLEYVTDNFKKYVFMAAGLFMIFSQFGLLLNGRLDKSAPQTFPTVVVDQYTHTSKGSTTWHLMVNDWRNPAGRVDLGVSRAWYDAEPVGNPLQVTTRKGWLGYEWIVSPR